MKSTLSVSEFKTHALSVFEEVSTKGLTILVTKRGKPLARVVPYVENDPEQLAAGRLAKWVAREGDLVAPLGPEMWSVSK